MSSPVEVGELIAGKYQVERVLGMGGMGVVVAAKHKTLGERYAIKFLLPQALTRPDVVKRFRQEAQAAARLKGEHVARVYDDGELPTGAPYLVMEYLDGHDLGAVLRDDGPLPVEHVVEHVMQACEALAEAHAAGIIHRDLKPSNLFRVKRLDGSPSIKLIDFGISKVMIPSAEGAAGEMTATAVMMGSPLYMAPEQMASARDVDARADIWSLGIILHTLLTGAPPFRAPTVMGVYELIGQGPPSVRQKRPEVPEGLEAVIHKCLQKDLRRRYADVGELAAALAPFGSPNAQAEVARIKRIIVTRTSAASLPPPAGTPLPSIAITPPPAAGEASGPPMTADSKPTASSEVAPRSGNTTGSSQSTGSSLSLDSNGTNGTNGPWDHTHPPTLRRRPVALIVASVLALAVGVPIAFFALRSQSDVRAKSGTDASSATASASPSSAPAETAKPSVSPGDTAKTQADPAPTASAGAPRATATAATTAPRPQPGPAQPRPRPKSSADLFGTQKY